MCACVFASEYGRLIAVVCLCCVVSVGVGFHHTPEIIARLVRLLERTLDKRFFSIPALTHIHTMYITISPHANRTLTCCRLQILGRLAG